ncbi:Pentapeptide repeat family protein [Minicystis rosea]|nr:Pentapeptide repeat family protein [Minicystis rosea]
MKVIKPAKLPVLTRVLERARRPELHVAAMLGFPLQSPRALLDEMAFWATVSAALGENGVVDEGLAKARGELLVAGSFHAPGGVPLPASYVRVHLGSVDKRLAILGNRVWKSGVPTRAEPIAAVPIDWAHAFGGAGFDRNAYGKGAAPIEVDGRAVHPLPNIERDGALLRAPSERPEPAGFSAMDVTFAQRRARAGTYDQRWIEEHFPGLPPDAAPTFHNVAPEDQWIEGFFRGDERFVVENMHPDAARLDGRLPGLLARSFVTRRTQEGERFVEIPMRWDTVWLFPSAGAGVVIAHGTLPVTEDDAADILHLVCACEDPGTRRPIEHYQATLARRLDKDKGAIAGLSDSDLMPPRASGVAPNIGEMDIGRWVKSENLARQNLKRGEERRRAESRAVIEAEGLDPKDYGFDDRPPEPPPPPDDPDALAAYIEEQSACADAMLADLEAKATAAKEQARQVVAEMGEDHLAMMEQATKKRMGPPKPPPLDDPDLADLDPALRVQIQRGHEGLVEMYRKNAHLQPTAAAMDPEASQRARVIVELARDTGESLARRDFTGANLSGVKLAGVDLAGAFLEAADLSGCDLSAANLEGAVLAKANLRDAKLTNTRMKGANLGGAQLAGALLDEVDFSDGILSRAEIAGARITRSNLAGVDWLETRVGAVDLSGSVLGECKLINADLRDARLAGVDLSGATLVECPLDGADLSRAVLLKTTFVGCKGRRVVFCGAQLRNGVIVHGSSFPEADFSDADLENANLRGTELTGARFSRANLAGADLSECDAGGAHLDRAILREGLMIRTNLHGASLRDANLMDALASKVRIAGADFSGANLYRADLSRAVGDERTSFAGAEVGHVRFQPRAMPPRGDA